MPILRTLSSVLGQSWAILWRVAMEGVLWLVQDLGDVYGSDGLNYSHDDEESLE